MHSRARRDGLVVHPEPVAVLVADRAEDPGRVVDERAVVEDPDAPGLEVLAAAERVDEPAEVLAFQGDGHRVDREVAAVEVVVDRARLDAREHRGRVVGLAARGDDVDALVVAVEDDRGPELPMRADTAVELLRQRLRQCDRIAFDHDVDVEARLAEQDVAHRAADEVDALVAVADGHDRVQHGPQPFGKLERRHGGSFCRHNQGLSLIGTVPVTGVRRLRSRRGRPTGGPRPRSSTAQAAFRRPAPRTPSSSPGSRRARRGRPSS